MIYTVIDEPNVPQQASARYATLLTHDILTEVLPYMHVFMTEELSEEEKEELSAAALTFAESNNKSLSENGIVSENAIEEETPEAPELPDDSVITFEEEPKERTFEVDPETGYYIEPGTGILLDPATGRPVDDSVSDLE